MTTPEATTTVTPTPSSSLTNIKGSLEAPIPTPTHGPGGSFSVLVTAHINAPPETVLAAVRDTKTWPTWNTFCPEGLITSGPGSAKTKTEAGTDGEEKGGGGDNEAGDEGILGIGSVVDIQVFMNGISKRAGDAGRRQGVIVRILDREVSSSAPTSDSQDLRSQDENTRSHDCRIAWISTGYSHWQLHSERVMEFASDGVGGTDYVCWETFGGILGRGVKMGFGRVLVERFVDYAGDLKGFCEGEGERG